MQAAWPVSSEVFFWHASKALVSMQGSSKRMYTCIGWYAAVKMQLSWCFGGRPRKSVNCCYFFELAVASQTAWTRRDSRLRLPAHADLLSVCNFQCLFDEFIQSSVLRPIVCKRCHRRVEYSCCSCLHHFLVWSLELKCMACALGEVNGSAIISALNFFLKKQFQLV